MCIHSVRLTSAVAFARSFGDLVPPLLPTVSARRGGRKSHEMRAVHLRGGMAAWARLSGFGSAGNGSVSNLLRSQFCKRFNISSCSCSSLHSRTRPDPFTTQHGDKQAVKHGLFELIGRLFTGYWSLRCSTRRRGSRLQHATPGEEQVAVLELETSSGCIPTHDCAAVANYLLARGLRHRQPGKREKSASLECNSAWCSMARLPSKNGGLDRPPSCGVRLSSLLFIRILFRSPAFSVTPPPPPWARRHFHGPYGPEI